jgi:hypothetical protein
MPMFATKFDDAILPFHDREPYRGAHQRLQSARRDLDALGERLGHARRLAGRFGPGGRCDNAGDPDPVEVAMARAGLPDLEREHAVAFAAMTKAQRDVAAAATEAKATALAELRPRRQEAVHALYAILAKAAELNTVVADLDQLAADATGAAQVDRFAWPELLPETATTASLLAHRRRQLEAEGWLS